MIEERSLPSNVGVYVPLLTSALLFFGIVIAGLFHMEERGIVFYALLFLSGFAFSVSLLNFTIRSVKELVQDYKRHGSFSYFLYDFFASVKLAIFLMLALGVLSMLGSTYIPQGQPIEFYLDKFGTDLGLWFWKLWLTNVFNSWYYILFIVLLAINLTVCSIKRLPRVWISTFTKERFQKLDERMEKHLNPITVSIKTNADAVGRFLSRLGFKVYVESEGSKAYIYGEKGRYSRLGVYVVHIGLLVIMGGALLDALTGIRGTLIVVEGSRSDILTVPSKNESYQLPFQVVLDKFHIVTYEEEAKAKGKEVDPSIKDAIASFESSIRIVENGVEVAKGKVSVNHPFDYGPYRIFQATYGLTGEVGRAKLAMFDKRLLSQSQDPKDAFVGNVEVINGKVSEFRDMLIAIDRSTINIEDENRGMEGELKPAIMLKVILDGKSYDVPVVYSPELTSIAYAQLQELRDFPYVFFMTEAEPQYFSGLQIAKKPGTWIIWFGSILVVGGMLLAFYTVHRKVWIRVEDETLKVAFWSHKLKEEFRKAFLKELERFKHESTGVRKEPDTTQ